MVFEPGSPTEDRLDVGLDWVPEFDAGGFRGCDGLVGPVDELAVVPDGSLIVELPDEVVCELAGEGVIDVPLVPLVEGCGVGGAEEALESGSLG